MANTSTSVINLYDLNDALGAELKAWGWTPETEEEYDALNNLTHDVYSTIQAFAEEVAR